MPYIETEPAGHDRGESTSGFRGDYERSARSQ